METIVTMTTTETDLSFEATRREIATDQGVLRFHEAGEGPPLVMLHGSGPGVSGWRNFRGNLATFTRSHRVLILEMPGFGLSDPIADHPAVGAVDSVLRFMDSLGVERADLIGNSFGGFIGSMLAMEHPSRLRRLVTVGGVGRNIFSPTPAEGVKIITDFVENPSRELLVRWLHSMVYDPALVTDELIEERWKQANDPATLACIRAMYGRGAGAGLYDAADDGPPPLWAQLHKIKAPTLLTWGRDDRVTPLDGALLPVRTIPDVELHVFPNCGHWVMIEAAGAWESAVSAFLTRP